MTNAEKVATVVTMFTNGNGEFYDLRDFPKENEFSTFLKKLKMVVTCLWSYLEPAKDLYVAYRQYTYKNYIMAALLTFFMYLPVA